MNDQYYVFFHLPAIYGFLHPNPQNLRRPVKFHPPPHQLVRSDAPVVGRKVSMDFRKKKTHHFWPTIKWNFGCFRCLPEMIPFLGVSKIPFLGVSKIPSIMNHSFLGGNPKIRGGYPKMDDL